MDRGDPSSALLEVLDPEQNNTSRTTTSRCRSTDQVLFITHRHLLDPIPARCATRMEVVQLPGYTETEKIEIGKRFLIPSR